jgi:hypothetical protein
MRRDANLENMRNAAIVLALAAASLAAPAFAQQVTVTVNGQPLNLNPGPIERAGRVFVPLRGIFERLGAGVVYASGTINATRGGTTVSLHIGSTQATVNGQPQILDVAPFIVGATTYVPLRFIAQSLGANVNYSDSTRVVAISMAHPMPPMPPPRPPAPPPPPPNVPPVQLTSQRPAPGSETANRFVVIAAEFSREVDASSVRVWLDGANRTMQSGVSSTGFSFKPPAPLSFGSHTVRVAGRGPRGVAFDRSWSFRVVRGAEPVPLTINQPSPNAAVGLEFTVQGNTVANGRVRVTAGASPSWTGQFNGTTTAGPRGNFKLGVTLTTMPGQQTVTLRITVTDPATSQTAETTMRLRLSR